jgi:endonuclease III
VEDFDPDDLEVQRGSLEHMIPKTRGPEFTELFSIHAKELCTEKDPHCSKCPLLSDCPTGQELTAKKPDKDKPDGKPKKSR